MKHEILLALISKMVQDRLESQEVISGLRGPRGFQGIKGADFSWADNEPRIKELIRESSLKFSDLSEEEITSLKGKDGKDGPDGKSFSWEENKSEIESLVYKHRLKFEDLDADQISAIRGPAGRDGKDGARGEDGTNGDSFSWDKYSADISALVTDFLLENRDLFKIQFGDLSDDDRESLRGPRGQRGRAGKDFQFEEHREFFEGLKLKFSDLSEAEVNTLKLKFKDLDQSEVEQLKLKFSDLSDEDRLMLRGPRGQRGSSGIHGLPGEKGCKGDTGIAGPRGPIGPKGIDGIRGRDGQDGADGQDAPTIDHVELKKEDNEISLALSMSNGEVLETNKVELPAAKASGGVTAFVLQNPNFSYNRIVSEFTLLVRENQQMLVWDFIDIEGTLELEGEVCLV